LRVKIGRDNLIMAEYVTEQIFSRLRNNAAGFFLKSNPPQFLRRNRLGHTNACMVSHHEP